MNLGFYQEYDKRKHKDLSKYKMDFLKSIIVNDKLYKFIAFDNNEYLNRIKFQSLEKGQLWFSYYKFLNDKTEFDMKYNVKKVSYRTGIPSDNIMFFIATMKEIYDVCSLTYSCENYMWKAYSNNSRGICLVFNVIDYDDYNFYGFVSQIEEKGNKKASIINYIISEEDLIKNHSFKIINFFHDLLDKQKLLMYNQIGVRGVLLNCENTDIKDAEIIFEMIEECQLDWVVIGGGEHISIGQRRYEKFVNKINNKSNWTPISL